MTLRAIIVDDEPLAREAIRVLLERDPEIEVAGECSGVGAAALIERTAPDIMFLDVQMPELDGFELIEAVGPDAVPAVVFATAYDEYALRAFEVHAIDYLLKPFDDARFERALARAKREAVSRRRGQSDPRIAALLRDRFPYARRFLVRTRNRRWWWTVRMSIGSRRPTTTYRFTSARRRTFCVRRWPISSSGLIQRSLSAFTGRQS